MLDQSKIALLKTTTDLDSHKIKLFNGTNTIKAENVAKYPKNTSTQDDTTSVAGTQDSNTESISTQALNSKVSTQDTISTQGLEVAPLNSRSAPLQNYPPPTSKPTPVKAIYIKSGCAHAESLVTKGIEPIPNANERTPADVHPIYI